MSGAGHHDNALRCTNINVPWSLVRKSPLGKRHPVDVEAGRPALGQRRQSSCRAAVRTAQDGGTRQQETGVSTSEATGSGADGGG